MAAAVMAAVMVMAAGMVAPATVVGNLSIKSWLP
jgi:hypothetical protein